MIISFHSGDLTRQPDLDVIVNAANRSLRAGGGVCGAIFKAAGAPLQESCLEYPVLYTVEDPDAADPLVRCPTGGAVATPAHNLPNKALIHAVGPVWGKQSEDASHALLRQTYRAALDLAVRHGFKTIGFPAISCGIYGYPLTLAAKITMTAVRDWVAEHPDSLDEIRLVFLPLGDGPEVLAHFLSAEGVGENLRRPESMTDSAPPDSTPS